MKSHLIAAAVLATGISSSAFAAVIASDSFDYVAGTNLNGNNGGTGWSTAWNNAAVQAYTVASPGLSITSGFSGITYDNTSAGNSIVHGTSYQNTVARTLSTTPSVAGDTYWFSMLLNLSGLSSSQQTRVKFLTSTTSTTNGLGFTLQNPGGANPSTQLWATIGGTGPAQTGPTLSLNTSYLIVGKLTANTTDAVAGDRVDLWAFADGATVDPAVFAGNGDAFLAGNQANYGNVIVLRSDASTAGPVKLDELRFGNTLEDVGVTIPEPATLGLLGLGGLALGRRRRNV